MKILKLLLFSFLISTHSYAEEKLFADYLYTSTIMSPRCVRARDSQFAIPRGSSCSLALKINLAQKPGANLIRLAKQKNYRPIYFWIEERIEDGQGNWKKISGIKQYRYNDVYQGISFIPNKTAIFRIAIDYLGQRAFKDTYDLSYKVTLK